MSESSALQGNDKSFALLQQCKRQRLAAETEKMMEWKRQELPVPNNGKIRFCLCELFGDWKKHKRMGSLFGRRALCAEEQDAAIRDCKHC